MRLIKHSITRSDQRGIPNDVANIIMEYGTSRIKSGHTFEFRLRKRTINKLAEQHKRAIHNIENEQRKAVVVSGDNKEIITLYHVN